MERQKKYDEDIINYVYADKVYVVFNMQGNDCKQDEFIFDYSELFPCQFVLQYYSDNIGRKVLLLRLNQRTSRNFCHKKCQCYSSAKKARNTIDELAKKNY
jgi:hypothetical protein